MQKINIESRINTFLNLYISGESTIEDEISLLNSMYSPATVIRYTTLYKKAFTSVGLDSKLFKLNSKFYKESRFKQSRLIKEKLNNKVEVFTKDIDYILNSYNSGTWLHKLVWLALVSGRRCIELIKTGNFEALDTINHVNFSGLSKQKKVNNRIIQIPLMTSYETFNSVLHPLRLELEKLYSIKGLSNVEINNKISKPLQRFINNNIDSNLLIKINSYKELRAIYAKYMCLLYKPSTKDSLIYMGEILGHREFDITTTLHYKSYVIYN